MAWKLTLELAEGGYVLTLEKSGRAGSRELAVCVNAPEMFARLCDSVPGMQEAAWEWSTQEIQRRLEAERGVASDG
jgi:hypothetical protein